MGHGVVLHRAALWRGLQILCLATVGIVLVAIIVTMAIHALLGTIKAVEEKLSSWDAEDVGF